MKLECYNNLKGTGHMPSIGVIPIEDDHEEPNCVDELPDVAKTDEAKRLVGIVPYDFDDGTPNGPPKPSGKEVKA